MPILKIELYLSNLIVRHLQALQLAIVSLTPTETKYGITIILNVNLYYLDIIPSGNVLSLNYIGSAY